MRWHDLSMDLEEKTPVFPGDAPGEFARLEAHGIRATRLGFSTHYGTHVDAPLHMLAGGKNLSEFGLEKFIGEGVVIDARGQREIRPKLDAVKAGDIVFFRTGHTDKASEPDYFDFERNPVIPLDTADALVAKKAKMVGLDSFTVDNEPYAVHQRFMKAGILIVENLVGLAPLAGKRVEVMALPLKVKDADGSPCRVIARPLDGT